MIRDERGLGQTVQRNAKRTWAYSSPPSFTCPMICRPTGPYSCSALTTESRYETWHFSDGSCRKTASSTSKAVQSSVYIAPSTSSALMKPGSLLNSSVVYVRMPLSYQTAGWMVNGILIWQQESRVHSVWWPFCPTQLEHPPLFCVGRPAGRIPSAKVFSCQTKE